MSHVEKPAEPKALKKNAQEKLLKGSEESVEPAKNLFLTKINSFFEKGAIFIDGRF